MDFKMEDRKKSTEKEITFQADGSDLVGEVFHFEENNGYAVICQHGYLACHRESKVRDIARKAFLGGYIGSTFTHRGHKGSGGREFYLSKKTAREDNEAFIKEIIRIGEIKGIFLVPSSMGAVGAFYTAINDEANLIKGIFALSPFNSLQSFIPLQNPKKIDALKKHYEDWKEGKSLDVYFGFDTYIEDGVEKKVLAPVYEYPALTEIDLIDAASRIKIPTTIVIGKNDIKIDPDSNRKLFENLRCEKRLIECEDDHCLRNHLEQLTEDMLNWFKEIIKKERKN